MVVASAACSILLPFFLWLDIRSHPQTVYLVERWVKPLQGSLVRALIKDDTDSIPQGALAPTLPFRDALNGPDRAEFDEHLQDALADYLNQADEYNRAVYALDAVVVPRLRVRAVALGLLSTSPLQGGITFHSAWVADDAQFAQFISELGSTKDLAVMVETTAPAYSFEDLRIAPPAAKAERLAEVRAMFEGVRGEAQLTSAVTDFTAARAKVLQSIADLRQELAATH
jgi:hypothetical protein